MHPTTVAGDLAKNVFELAVADVHWHVVARHRFTRRQFERFLASQPACHIAMEACGTAHHWGRVAHGHGHQVTLLPAQYVRPYACGTKTDRTDAEALLEAARSDRLVPVAVKTVAQQELLALHRIRDQWMATRTARINALRGFLREQGILLPRDQPCRPTAPEDPGHRLPHRDCLARHRRAHSRLPPRTPLRQLARAHAA